MPKLDVNQMLIDEGMTLVGKRDDGKLSVMDAEGKPGVIDLPQLAQDSKIDLANTEVIYNTPENFADSNAVGFALGTKLARTKTPEDKVRLLTQAFGEGNVRDDVGGITVKDKDGIWKKADTSFLQEMAGSAPESVGGMIGSAIGGTLGFISPIPGGTFLGTVAGGAIGSAIGKWANIADAEKSGIRTEADGEEIAKELGWEFAQSAIFDMALLGAGKLAKIGGKQVASTVRKAFEHTMDKETIAQFAAQQLPGLSVADARVPLESVPSAMNVVKNTNKYLEWEFNRLANPTSKEALGMDPLERESVGHIMSMLSETKKAATTQYGDKLKLFQESVSPDTRVDLSNAANEFIHKMRLNGLVDEKGKWLGSKGQLSETGLGLVGSPTSEGILKKMYTINSSILNQTDPNGKGSWAMAKSLMDYSDELAQRITPKNGDFRMGTAIQNELRTYRAGLTDKMLESIPDNAVVKTGSEDAVGIKAKDFWKEMQSTYHQFRSAYDVFALNTGGTKTEQAKYLVDRMMGDGGAQLQETAGKLMASVGQKFNPTYQALKELAAGKAWAKMYPPSKKGWTSVIGRATLGSLNSPQEAISAVAKRSIAINKGIDKRVAKQLEKRGVSALDQLPDEEVQQIMAKSQPIAKEKLVRFKAQADVINLMNSMDPIKRATLLSSPELLSSLGESVYSAGNLYNDIVNQAVPQE